MQGRRLPETDPIQEGTVMRHSLPTYEARAVVILPRHKSGSFDGGSFLAARGQARAGRVLGVHGRTFAQGLRNIPTGARYRSHHFQPLSVRTEHRECTGEVGLAQVRQPTVLQPRTSLRRHAVTEQPGHVRARSARCHEREPATGIETSQLEAHRGRRSVHSFFFTSQNRVGKNVWCEPADNLSGTGQRVVEACRR